MVSQGATPFWSHFGFRWPGPSSRFLLRQPPDEVNGQHRSQGFLPCLKESWLRAGHLNPQNLEANKDLPHGRGSKV